jgi:hypothetical protein
VTSSFNPTATSTGIGFPEAAGLDRRRLRTGRTGRRRPALAARLCANQRERSVLLRKAAALG